MLEDFRMLNPVCSLAVDPSTDRTAAAAASVQTLPLGIWSVVQLQGSDANRITPCDAHRLHPTLAASASRLVACGLLVTAIRIAYVHCGVGMWEAVVAR